MNDATPSSVLVAGIPRRHLSSAAETCRRHGSVVLPAGGPGDLDSPAPGTEVLLLVAGPDEVPAATWHARFVRRVLPGPGEIPALVPPTWVEDNTSPAPAGTSAIGEPDEDADEDEDARGPQSFFEIERLEELPTGRWVYANELVRKQERGGRAFFPRVPRLIRRPA